MRVLRMVFRGEVAGPGIDPAMDIPDTMARSPDSTPRGEGFPCCVPAPNVRPPRILRPQMPIARLRRSLRRSATQRGLPPPSAGSRRTTRSSPPQPGSRAGRGARSLILVAATAAGALLAPEPTLAVLLALMAIPFLMVVALRAAALWHLLAGRARAAPMPRRASRRRAASALHGAGAALSRGRRRAASVARARRDRLSRRPARGAADRRERRSRDAGRAARRDARALHARDRGSRRRPAHQAARPAIRAADSHAATTSSSTTPRTCPSPTSCAARSPACAPHPIASAACRRSSTSTTRGQAG